ncbi:MAG TPA: pseudaminic acid synthase, partial [Candidatus Ozemobacteraceae bacterium]|nr:pseudaminic acid synthase [Candidatus Ozemobacteraceae bacterium]
MNRSMNLGTRRVGAGHPTYIIAELSANHNQDLEKALALIRAAKDAGADAVKLQTYRPDTLTIDCDKEFFRIKGGLWGGKNLFQLYGEAFTPWEWHQPLLDEARRVGIDLFSTPFDASAVDFLEQLGMSVYKIASFENVDLPLLRKIASTGKPVIMSTGMATLAELDESVNVLRQAGCQDLALLKCTSAYPAPASEMHLRTIPHLSAGFNVPVGLSDHTLGIAVPVTAVAVGACIIEKHFTLSRGEPGPDSAFSLEPAEFQAMVTSIRQAEQALGGVHYGLTDKEREGRTFRRSL